MKREDIEKNETIVLGLHAKHKTNTEIAVETGFSDCFIDRALRKHNLKGHRKANHKMTLEEKQKVIRLIVECGMSAAKAGRETGVSSTAAQKLWREYKGDHSADNTKMIEGCHLSLDDGTRYKQGRSEIIEGLKMIIEGLQRLEENE